MLSGMVPEGPHTPVRKDRSGEAMRQRNIVRRALINELHFTNKKMVQLLPTLASRAGQGRTGQLLRAQSEVDRTIGLRLKNTAVEHGDPPSPCLCEEAQALLANVYYADRNKADKWVRHRAVIQALKAVRVYMIRSWGALIDRLAAEGEELFQQEASALQQVEASLHRELVQLANKLEGELPNA